MTSTPIRREVYGRQCVSCGSLFAGARDAELCRDCTDNHRYGGVTLSEQYA